jgi:hypothetical protein
VTEQVWFIQKPSLFNSVPLLQCLLTAHSIQHTLIEMYNTNKNTVEGRARARTNAGDLISLLSFLERRLKIII